MFTIWGEKLCWFRCLWRAFNGWKCRFLEPLSSVCLGSTTISSWQSTKNPSAHFFVAFLLLKMLSYNAEQNIITAIFLYLHPSCVVLPSNDLQTWEKKIEKGFGELEHSSRVTSFGAFWGFYGSACYSLTMPASQKSFVAITSIVRCLSAALCDELFELSNYNVMQ